MIGGGNQRFQPNRGPRPAPADDSAARELRGARPGHQQLPPADRPAHGAGLQGDRRLLAIVRLGEGLFASGRALRGGHGADDGRRSSFAPASCAAAGSRALRAVATEACRRAENCAEFLARVRAATGIELEIISLSEEAGLALAGCTRCSTGACPCADLRYRRRQHPGQLARGRRRGGRGPLARPAAAAAARLAFRADRRRDPGGELRRRGHLRPATYDAMVAEVTAALGPLRGGAPPVGPGGLGRHADARHLRHGDHAGRESTSSCRATTARGSMARACASTPSPRSAGASPA